MSEAIPGHSYKHYKGRIYFVVCTAKHSETEVELVVYVPREGGQVWARPKEMFEGQVTVDGQLRERFADTGKWSWDREEEEPICQPEPVRTVEDSTKSFAS